MTDSDWRVLVPVEILEGETIPDSVVEALETLPVVVLGYHVLPEQTPPDQARLQFEDQAQTKLDELADSFLEAGGAAETRLVFTHDEEQTLERVADETGCAAILIPNPAATIEELLLPIEKEANVDRIASFVQALLGDRDIDVTLFHVAANEDAAAAGETLLADAVERLKAHGISGEAIATEVAVSGSPVQTIANAAGAYDAVVMGESEPSLRSFLFGETSEQVAALSLGPVIVVRRERPPETDAEQA